MALALARRAGARPAGSGVRPAAGRGTSIQAEQSDYNNQSNHKEKNSEDY